MLTLHIGLPKTGTTFLQYRVFNRQRAITYIHRPKDTAPDAVERLLKRLVRVGDGEVPALEEQLLRALPDDDALVSNENISINAEEAWTGRGPDPAWLAARVARLSDLVGGVQIVLGIRRQDQWLASRYAESAKTFPEFGQADFERRIAGLCAAPLRGVMGWLDYDAAHAALADHVGEHRVLLVPAESLSRAPEAELGRLEAFIGREGLVSTYQGLVGTTDMRRNVLSAGHNRWTLRGRDTTLTLPDALMHLVRERFAGGNRVVAKAAGLDLAPHGYC